MPGTYISPAETKLYYCNSRYYDPQIRRFINADALMSTGAGFLGFNMFAYCNNNPVMYYDPSGNIVTEWDREHLTAKEISLLEDFTWQWETATSEEARYQAHSNANMYRSKYLEGYEMILPNGHVISDEYVIEYYFEGYTFTYDIKPTAISVTVNSKGFKYFRENGDLEDLAEHMLNTYKSIYGLEFADRTKEGMAIEIEKHAEWYEDYGGWSSYVAKKCEQADLECSYYIGHHNYWLFELLAW